MPALTKRRPKGTRLPTKKADVPGWLASAYGITFLDGEPDIPGWGAATSRAEAIIEDPAHAWLEHLANLSPGLAAARTPAERKAIDQKILAWWQGLLRGNPFEPNVQREAKDLMHRRW